MGLPFYFGVYETAKQKLLANSNESRDIKVMISGGLGGTAFWIVTYPIGIHNVVCE